MVLYADMLVELWKCECECECDLLIDITLVSSG